MPVARQEFRNPWREQWARTERWYARLASVEPVHVEDFALVVLAHCFAMRDWMSEPTGFARADVKKLFEGDAFRLCRDVTNGLKHLRLDRPSVDADFRIVREYAPRFVDGQEVPGSREVILAGGVVHDLCDLCHTCVKELRAFIEASGHTVPKADYLA